METITSLIFLSVFLIPPMMLAGKEAMDVLFLNKLKALLARQGLEKDTECQATKQDQPAVYDGMATVEIPVFGPQIVAYEPVLPPGEDYSIELLDPPGRASNA